MKKEEDVIYLNELTQYMIIGGNLICRCGVKLGCLLEDDFPEHVICPYCGHNLNLSPWLKIKGVNNAHL